MKKPTPIRVTSVRALRLCITLDNEGLMFVHFFTKGGKTPSFNPREVLEIVHELCHSPYKSRKKES